MIKTIELFAGVGGFRLGLEKNNTKQNNSIFPPSKNNLHLNVKKS